MSLKLGGSKEKTSSTSNSTSNSSFNTTTTPNAPEWASTLTQNVAGRVGDLMHLDPQGLIAPADGLQTQAAASAGRLTGQPGVYTNATNVTGQVADSTWLNPYLSADTPFASGGKAYDWIDRYMNPYQKNVIDASLADFDFDRGNTMAQQDLDLAGSGAFSGSGVALTKSMTDAALARTRNKIVADLSGQGFQTALNAAAGDADRATQARIANAQMALQDRAQKVGWQMAAGDQRLKSASQLADLAGAYDADQRANIAAQAQMGDTLRGIDQQQRQAPVTNAQQIVAMLSGLPISLFTGQTQSGTQTGTQSGSSTGKSSGFNWGASVSAGYNPITGWSVGG
jgi:hypothetical protein